ncbi:hypothetical protein DL96DRAFT_1553274 [Flagelloscypha sp. PMI_526]|nr:hypothetical protein DL96DRAFT_1553274 [Flagelloscypha sp. PMI_526]
MNDRAGFLHVTIRKDEDIWQLYLTDYRQADVKLLSRSCQGPRYWEFHQLAVPTFPSPCFEFTAHRSLPHVSEVPSVTTETYGGDTEGLLARSMYSSPNEQNSLELSQCQGSPINIGALSGAKPVAGFWDPDGYIDNFYKRQVTYQKRHRALKVSECPRPNSKILRVDRAGDKETVVTNAVDFFLLILGFQDDVVATPSNSYILSQFAGVILQE